MVAILGGDGWNSHLGNVRSRSENNFPEGGLEINSSTSAGRSMNGKYTPGASGVKEAGEISP